MVEEVAAKPDKGSGMHCVMHNITVTFHHHILDYLFYFTL